MNLTKLKQDFKNEDAYHKHVNRDLVALVNADPLLEAHRNYIDQFQFGFGERSFQFVWKLICEQLPDSPSLLEIGCYKGQILSLWKLLRPDANVFGVTPLDDTGLGWQHEEGFYANAIKKIHDDFELEQPILIVGKSNEVSVEGKFDCVYIDGSHQYADVLYDLETFAPKVKSGGWLVIDDCAIDMDIQSELFPGIKEVQDAYDAWDKSDFEFWFTVVHLRVMRRK